MSVPEKKTPQRLGEAIKKLRERTGMSLGDVAEHMGKKRSAAAQLGRWERGETNPTALGIWSYLSALDATFADLHRVLDPKPAASRRLAEIATELEHMATEARKRSSPE